MGVKWIPKYYWYIKEKNNVRRLDSILKFLVYWEIHCWPLLCKDNEIFVIFPDTRAHKPLMQIAIFLNDFGWF